MIVYHHMILTTIALVLMLMMTSSVVPAMELAYLLGIMIHIDLHALQLNQSAVRVRSPANRQTIINTGMPSYYYPVYYFSGPHIQLACFNPTVWENTINMTVHIWQCLSLITVFFIIPQNFIFICYSDMTEK